MVNPNLHSRGGQESCNSLQNSRIALHSVIESWGVDESHSSPIENKFIRKLNLRCGVRSDPQIRATCEIDKLEAVE